VWGSRRSTQAARPYFEINSPSPSFPRQVQLYDPFGAVHCLTHADLWPSTPLPSERRAGQSPAAPPPFPSPPASAPLVPAHHPAGSHGRATGALSSPSGTHFHDDILHHVPGSSGLGLPSESSPKCPTPASLRHGLGTCGNALNPPDLWTGLGLPRQLPRNPACSTRTNTLSEILLNQLVRTGIIFRAHSQPAAPAFATSPPRKPG
jgi:hypothetical protein